MRKPWEISEFGGEQVVTHRSAQAELSVAYIFGGHGLVSCFKYFGYNFKLSVDKSSLSSACAKGYAVVEIGIQKIACFGAFAVRME